MAENSEWKNDEEEARARKEAEAAVRHARDYHMRKQGYWKGFFVGFFACVAGHPGRGERQSERSELR